ncbi:MAG: hypothetical protein EPO24_12165 [Bacteroidetes bacterium]|nr:MAG: hypothetical protein EPO24_12165 [Bacteroidota bacterium]
MGRILLWLLLFWVVWRIFRNMTAVSARKKERFTPPTQQPRNGTFLNIEDAEFEDVTKHHEEQQ